MQLSPISLAALAALFGLALLPTQAAAQVPAVTGTWQCQFGVRPISNPNLIPVYVEFTMQVNVDGTMRAQGVANQMNQFQAQGQWQVDQTQVFYAQGQMQDALGLTPFNFVSRVTCPQTMNMEQADQVNQMASQCAKVG